MGENAPRTRQGGAATGERTSRTRQCGASGFTIVEVTLAMAFLAILLIGIAVTVMRITTVYQKGLTMKNLNATGRELVDEFSRAIGAEKTAPVTNCAVFYPDPQNNAYQECVKDNGLLFVYQIDTGGVDLDGDGQDDKTVPLRGLMCTGKTTYIWNSGYLLGDNYMLATNVAQRGSYDGNNTFRLLKVQDYGGNICKNRMETSVYTYSTSPTFTTDKDNHGNTSKTYSEILTSTENNLALYDFQLFKPTIHATTGHAFYSGTFTLATIRGDISIEVTGGDYCKVTDEDSAAGNLDSDFTYCSINKFNFAMRATGETIKV